MLLEKAACLYIHILLLIFFKKPHPSYEGWGLQLSSLNWQMPA